MTDPEPKTTKFPPSSAPPPAHAVAIVVVVAAACLLYLPPVDPDDDGAAAAAAVRSISTPLFPRLIPTARELGLIRLLLSAAIFATQAAQMRGGRGLVQITSYRPQSRLVARPMIMRGWRVLGYFTTWTWTLLGISFALNGSVALLVAAGREEFLIRNPLS